MYCMNGGEMCSLDHHCDIFDVNVGTDVCMIKSYVIPGVLMVSERLI